MMASEEEYLVPMLDKEGFELTVTVKAEARKRFAVKSRTDNNFNMMVSKLDSIALFWI